VSGTGGQKPSVDDPSTSADVEVVRAKHVRAYDEARAAGDVDAMAAAALALASIQQYGAFPGMVPAFLHEAYTRAQGEQRACLAVAIARSWAYSNNPQRATAFAAEALEYAERHDDPTLLAQALDAQLLVHWGPDDLDERLLITARLDDVVAHLTDVEARMNAHLWRLTTALECLDVTGVRRQLRALDFLAVDSGSPRVRFFASARRGMHALLVSDLDDAAAARDQTVEAGLAAGETDTYAMERTLTSGIARQTGDVARLVDEAEKYESYGVRESVPAVIAEGAGLWVAAGELERARRLLRQVVTTDFDGVVRDVDWLLTVALLTDVATAVGDVTLAEAAVRTLSPYAGRGVVNGGAVAFVGVVDDYLAGALRLLGRTEETDRHAAQARELYARVGASWWLGRIGAYTSTTPRAGVAHLRLGADGLWCVGRDDAVATVREVKGFHYLRLLLARPGVDVPAHDLSDEVAGHAGAGVADGAVDEVLDRRALAAYRQRLADLDAELDEARSWSDSGRLARLEDERDALLDQLRAATGLGGRARTTGGATERARIAVRKAIATAIERVGTVDASLGRILADTVTTGATCRYQPDPDRPVAWVLTGVKPASDN
jgi:hypothetical protein